MKKVFYLLLALSIAMVSCTENHITIVDGQDPNNPDSAASGVLTFRSTIGTNSNQRVASSQLRTTSTANVEGAPSIEEVFKNTEVNGTLSIIHTASGVNVFSAPVRTFDAIANIVTTLPYGDYRIETTNFNGYEDSSLDFTFDKDNTIATLRFVPTMSGGFVWWNATIDTERTVAVKMGDTVFNEKEGNIGKMLPAGEKNIELGYLNDAGDFVATYLLKENYPFEVAKIVGINIDALEIMVDPDGKPNVSGDLGFDYILEYEIEWVVLD
ncbi:hypothetical protein [Algivirga pacifica]|uniref:DUF4397 domain-containing protein n=1 Tax=Algivirga pacifica TaxID=1162670 RepID=A0ABP9D5W0_9BACT